ncbi:MAG: hypothetical protein J6M21_03825 [Campylobacter sp.]|nr:hypothetical protein [Campylobacter sp.]
MIDRIFALFVGIMAFLHAFSLLYKQKVSIGVKYLDFSNMGIFYLLPVFAFFILGSFGFYFAFRSQKNIKKYPEYLKCLNCETTWWFGHVKNSKDKCPNCGGKLVDLKKYETHKNRQRNLEKIKNKPKKRSVRNKRKNNKGNENE